MERRKIRVVRVMDWWHKLILPVRKAWIAVSARLRSRKHGGGLLNLHDDIQTCGYQDVQVMWEMLCRTEMELSQAPTRKGGPLWKMVMWPSRRLTTSLNRAH